MAKEQEVVLTLRLPRDLHAQLQAIGGSRGLTREIRERLQASLEKATMAGAPDELTANLQKTIGLIAELVRDRWGAWQKAPAWRLDNVAGTGLAGSGEPPEISTMAGSLDDAARLSNRAFVAATIIALQIVAIDKLNLDFDLNKLAFSDSDFWPFAAMFGIQGAAKGGLI